MNYTIAQLTYHNRWSIGNSSFCADIDDINMPVVLDSSAQINIPSPRVIDYF